MPLTLYSEIDSRIRELEFGVALMPVEDLITEAIALREELVRVTDKLAIYTERLENLVQSLDVQQNGDDGAGEERAK